MSCVLAACVIYSSAMNSVSESLITLSMPSSSAISTTSNKAYVCSLLAFSSIGKYLFLPLVAISPQKALILFREQNVYKKAIASFDFFFLSIIMSCRKYKRYSLLTKSKRIIAIKRGTKQIQYP